MPTRRGGISAVGMVIESVEAFVERAHETRSALRASDGALGGDGESARRVVEHHLAQRAAAGVRREVVEVLLYAGGDEMGVNSSAICS